MKKADNFDAGKWLVENKLTTQSRLNEEEKKYYLAAKSKDGKKHEVFKKNPNYIKTTYDSALKLINSLKKPKHYTYYVSDIDGNPVDKNGNIINESRLNENKISGIDVEVDDDMVTLSGDSGDYDGFIENDGIVKFSIVYDDMDEEFTDENWKDILGDDHVFVKVANAIPTKVEAMDDYVMITVKASDLNGMNESNLKEALTMNPVESIEKYGFVKIKNREEYLQAVPVLTQAGYSLVGDKFPTKVTPFDAGYGQRRQPRKNSIYLMKYWSEDKTGKYKKFLWIADYLNKSKTSDRFPIGQPDTY